MSYVRGRELAMPTVMSGTLILCGKTVLRLACTYEILEPPSMGAPPRTDLAPKTKDCLAVLRAITKLRKARLTSSGKYLCTKRHLAKPKGIKKEEVYE